ncbi:putative ribonuclease H-like domain-containing protein [Tanacetum coccineum]
MVLGTVDINNLHIPFTYQHILASSHNINSLIAQSAHHTSQDGDYRISLCYTMNRQEVNNSFAVPTQPTNSSQHDILLLVIISAIQNPLAPSNMIYTLDFFSSDLNQWGLEGLPTWLWVAREGNHGPLYSASLVLEVKWMLHPELHNLLIQQKEGYVNSTNRDSTASPSVSTAGPSINTASENINTSSPNINTASPILNDSSMQSLENIGIFDDAYDDREVGAEADLNNLETTMNASSIPTTRIHKDHPKDQIIGDINSATQTRRMTTISKEHVMKVIQALTDPSWIEAMQEELLQFNLQKVWTLVDLLKGKRAIGTKWVYRNKKDERGIIVRNKARLVAQGYTQEEGIDYDEVFAPVARIEAIWLFLAYALFMGFIMYQMDVKSAFLYGTIEKEVYACQPPGFEDPQFPDKVYKKDKGDILLVQVDVDDIIFGSTKKSLCLEFEQIMHKRFQMSSMGKLTFFLGLQVQQKEDGIFISQDMYMADILKIFDFITVKTASTPIEHNKALVKDEKDDNVDVYLYILMIGPLMYLTASRPDITFVVCACARFQVTPKVSHLHAVKRIFRYLKGQPKLGLWYHRDSPFDLEAFSDSDYAGASLDRKSTTGDVVDPKSNA